jgi:hypothetical protein
MTVVFGDTGSDRALHPARNGRIVDGNLQAQNLASG